MKKGYRSRTRAMRLKQNNQLLLPANASSLEEKKVLVTLRVTARPENLRIKGARKCPHCWFRRVYVKPGETCGH